MKYRVISKFLHMHISCAFEQSKMQKSMVSMTSKIPPPRGLEKCISRTFDTRPKAEEVMPRLTAQNRSQNSPKRERIFFRTELK